MSTPTFIDWSDYQSDGVSGRYTGQPSTRLDTYIGILLTHINKDPDILHTFGRFMS
jgi:hypothetical protein